MLKSRVFLCLGVFAISAAILLMPSKAALAQEFPTKTITLVVPYGPGGPADQLGRAIAEKLSQVLDPRVVVSNKPGAGTSLAASYVAQSDPDGHTIFLGSFASFVSNPLLTPDLPYKVEEDFAGVSLVAVTPMVMVIDPDVPANSVSEFVAYAEENPDDVNFGTSGPGTTVHLAAELFKSVSGVEMTHVPYSSSAEVINALLSGYIQVAFDLVLTAKPQHEAGDLRILAVTDTERSPLLPEIPTIAEAGYSSYSAGAWFGLAVPDGTPEPAIKTLNAAVRQALNDESLQARFLEMGMTLRASAPEAMMERAAADRKKWKKIIDEQDLGLRN